MIVNVIFRRRTDAPPQWGPRSYLPSKSDEDEVVVLVLPPYLPTYSSLKHALRLTITGLRTRSEGAALAQASAVTVAEGWAQGQTREGTAVVLLSLSNRRD